MTHAAESTHWYDRAGNPAYEVRGANGKQRPTTLRDARKLGLCPSVTTVIKCAAAEGLIRWQQNQVLMAALTLPRIEGESSEALCARIIRDSQEQGRKARDKGTDIHAAVQGHYEGRAPDPEYWEHVKGAANVIAANCIGDDWIAEKSFSHLPLGFGGKVDLHSRSWVIDFKTKEFTSDQFGELKTWDEHAMQLAAYRLGLQVPTARCGIVYVSTVEPGLARLIEIDEPELRRGFDMFRGLLNYWQAKAGYWPTIWQPEEAQKQEAA
jgi:hypothetical protein